MPDPLAARVLPVPPEGLFLTVESAEGLFLTVKCVEGLLVHGKSAGVPEKQAQRQENSGHLLKT